LTLMKPGREFLIAIQLLTSFPIKIKGEVSAQELGKSSVFFPLVGAILGGVLVLVNLILETFLPSGIVAILIVIALVLLTGGLHLEGFADTIDGLASRKSKDEILAIMRDPRIGAIVVAGVVLILLLKVGLLQSIPRHSLNFALILMPVLSRWSLVLAACISPYARNTTGLGKPFIEYTKSKELLIATFYTFIPVIALLRTNGAILCVLILGLTLGFAKLIIRRIGGFTGDTFGALNEVMEVMVLLTLLFLLQ